MGSPDLSDPSRRVAELFVDSGQNNAARIALSIDKAARTLIRNGQVDDGLLNQVEMSFRAYDPCFGCSTQSLPGQMALIVEVRDAGGTLVQELRRD